MPMFEIFSIIKETKVKVVSHGVSFNFKFLIWIFNIYLSGKAVYPNTNTCNNGFAILRTSEQQSNVLIQI